ncbi:MAG: hypothetical protein JNM27_21250, partial [Leptospirales bacterium]|nr:hypothetical protein [Leptospirales bacterium]
MKSFVSISLLVSVSSLFAQETRPLVLPDSLRHQRPITEIAQETKTDTKAETKIDKPETKVEPAAIPQAVCLHVTRRIPSSAQPHASPRVVTDWSVGLKLGPRIVTDVDNVRGAVSISYRSPDARSLSQARLPVYGWDTGLALIQTDESATEPVLETEGAELDSEITVAGCGPTSVELTRLRVDAVYRGKLDNNDTAEFQLLRPSSPRSPSALRSGSPVFIGKKFAGLYHAGKSNYVLHAYYVMRFLEDAKDGKYDGMPRRSFDYQSLQHPDLRKFLNLPDTLHGVRITRTFGESLLLPGDFLKSLDGAPISDEGLIKVKGSLVTLDDFFGLRRAGPITAIVDRGGKDISLALSIGSPEDYLRARSTGDRRVFFYGAGLIFQELDYEIIHDHRSGADSQLRYRYEARFEDRLNRETDLDVVLTNVFPDAVNAGADVYTS